MREKYIDADGEIILPDMNLESYDGEPLDLFSTSPTLSSSACATSFVPCVNNAPFFAYQIGKDGRTYGVVQGSCNSWNCPRCGKLVAKEHYGRIVSGARAVGAKDELWFLTVTCGGKEISETEAFTFYLKWTSKFLDACYTRASRERERWGSDTAWSYVQVTEKQKRGHPHSHILTTFTPYDLYNRQVKKWHRDNAGVLVSELETVLGSAWIEAQLERSGLGEHYDISRVRTVEAVSRYVAKYMFKDSQFQQQFPKHWKRVRYAQTWPKLPDKKTNAFVLLSRQDWQLLAGSAVTVVVNRETEGTAEYWLKGNDVLLVVRDS
jgi:hypothetical protein